MGGSMTDRAPEASAVAPTGGRTAGGAGGVTVVFRPHLGLRLLGPALAVVGVVGAAAGLLPALALLVVAVPVTLVWFRRIELDDATVRYRRLLATTTIPLGGVREVALRRVPRRGARAPHHSYRVGRFSTTPIRLRIAGEEAEIHVTAALWPEWPRIVRALMTLPGVQTDHRSRGRLDRYG